MLKERYCQSFCSHWPTGTGMNGSLSLSLSRSADSRSCMLRPGRSSSVPAHQAFQWRKLTPTRDPRPCEGSRVSQQIIGIIRREEADRNEHAVQFDDMNEMIPFIFGFAGSGRFLIVSISFPFLSTNRQRPCLQWRLTCFSSCWHHSA